MTKAQIFREIEKKNVLDKIQKENVKAYNIILACEILEQKINETSESYLSTKVKENAIKNMRLMLQIKNELAESEIQLEKYLSETYKGAELENITRYIFDYVIPHCNGYSDKEIKEILQSIKK